MPSLSLLLRRTTLLRLPFSSPFPFCNTSRIPSSSFQSFRFSSSSSSSYSKRAFNKKFKSTVDLGYHLTMVVSASDHLEKGVRDKVLSSIQEAEKMEVPQLLQLPEDFPFEVVENPGITITLKRELANEKINVTVWEDASEKTSGDAINKTIIVLEVAIHKEDVLTLHFFCNLSSDGLDIEEMFVETSNETYKWDLPAKIANDAKEYFRKYLEVIGIKSSLFDLLEGLELKKYKRDEVLWKRNVWAKMMKDLIQKYDGSTKEILSDSIHE